MSKRSFPEENRLLQTIPGVSETCAATVLAEIGPISFKNRPKELETFSLIVGLLKSFFTILSIEKYRIISPKTLSLKKIKHGYPPYR
ncbi:transposase [Streptococcus henryi]|uniref:transposase n=1 Tax=Streptococcus henryi TaxID=439219 RepID=UPI00114D410D